MNIRSAESVDWPTIGRLLSTESLPTEDLYDDQVRHFLVAERRPDNEIIGVIGYQEMSACTGLLRSLAVDKAARSRGLGAILVGEIELAAKMAGITNLWLLTIDADDFFSKLGFVSTERSAVPREVRQSREFVSLCPGDAVVMHKVLE